jgi:hypothetical protein
LDASGIAPSASWPGDGDGYVRQHEELGCRYPRRGVARHRPAAILIGAFAGLMPAVRAAQMPSTMAIRAV